DLGPAGGEPVGARHHDRVAEAADLVSGGHGPVGVGGQRLGRLALGGGGGDELLVGLDLLLGEGRRRRRGHRDGGRDEEDDGGATDHLSGAPATAQGAAPAAPH